MGEPGQVDINLQSLQKKITEPYPKLPKKIAERAIKGTLQETTAVALRKLNTVVEVNGVFNGARTLIVANHPNWQRDPLCVSQALGEAADNTKFFVRNEVLSVIPEHLRQHVIPVDTRESVKRAGSVRGLGSVVSAHIINRVLPHSSSLRDVVTALHIGADHVVQGGNTVIFEGAKLQEELQGKNTWDTGVAAIVQRIVATLPENEDAFLQLVAMDMTRGNPKNPFSQKTVEMNVSRSISLRELVRGLGEKSNNRRTLTDAIQNRYIQTFTPAASAI